MKKLIVLPGANLEELENLSRYLNNMGDDGHLLVPNDIKIYDIDNAVCWTKEEIKNFMKDTGLEFK